MTKKQQWFNICFMSEGLLLFDDEIELTPEDVAAQEAEIAESITVAEKKPIAKGTWKTTGSEAYSLTGPCRDKPELFFSPEKESPRARATRERKAVALCQLCEMKQPCLEYALRNKLVDGIWGDTTEEERRAIWESDKTLKSA